MGKKQSLAELATDFTEKKFNSFIPETFQQMTVVNFGQVCPLPPPLIFLTARANSLQAVKLEIDFLLFNSPTRRRKA
jgi:hypothetical protein